MAKGKVIHSGDACTVLVEGNIKKRLEPSEHMIEFPGGSISVMRTSDNEYWAHIWVNKKQVLEDIHILSKPGRVVEGRIDYDYPEGIDEIHGAERVSHIAIRISTKEVGHERE